MSSFQRIERNFQEALAIVFWLRKSAAADVDLQGVQDEARHLHLAISLLSQRNVGCLVLAGDMDIAALLISDGALPRRIAPPWLVVMPRKKACRIGQRKDALD